MKTVAIGNYKVGAGHPLLVMAGPASWKAMNGVS